MLERNIAKVRHALLTAVRDCRFDVIKADVSAVPRKLAGLAGNLDLVLADPPYRPGDADYGGHSLLTDPDMREWVGDALLVLEHATKDRDILTPSVP